MTTGKGTGVRVILHLDMNSFFASVEQKYNPSLKGKPMAVAGNPEKRRGILVTCSYEARAFGVYTTMTVGEARRLCPEIVIVPPNFDKYRLNSTAVFDVLRTYTPLVEPVSIDEAYIDITEIGGLQHAPKIAAEIQGRLVRELDLPCSIGIAPNKFLAKTASDMKKPMGITILRKRNIQAKLWPLPVIEMHGIGASTEKKLHSLHIKTIGDLAQANEVKVQQLLGKNGIRLVQRANGIDDRLVDPEAAEDRKSVGSSTTLPIDETDREECLKIFQWLAEKVAKRLQEQELAGFVIMIQIRTADWQNQTRSRTLINAVYQANLIYEEAKKLFIRHWDGEPIRLLGITVSNVIPIEQLQEQLSIYNFEEHAAAEKVDRLITDLNKKFGEETIRKGSRKKNL